MCDIIHVSPSYDFVLARFKTIGLAMMDMKKLLVVSLVVLGVVSAQAWAEDGFKNESEVGLIMTSGNTDAKTVNAKEVTSYEFNKNTFKNTGSFLRSKNNGAESANAWSLGIRYERALSEHFSIYIGQSVDADKFQKIRQRYNSDLGGKYIIQKTDTFNWFTEGGYRFTKENRFDKTVNFSYLRAYTEVEYKFNPSVSAKYWLEYLPNLTVSDDYQINTEVSLAASLTSVFSVKSGYLVRFDNLPATGVLFRTDKVFTTALVAKF